MKHLSKTVLAAALLASSAAYAGTLSVKVDGVASGKGEIRVAVCDETTFLKKCALGAKVPAKAGSSTVEVPNVPEGTWAVMAYHDENGNEKMDRNAMGIPTEGYGFSNGAVAKFGPPQFKQASFAVGAAPASAQITLNY